MRLIDADAAAEKLMQEAMKHATDINGGLAVQLLLMLAKCLRDKTDFPTVYPHEIMDPVRVVDDRTDLVCTGCGQRYSDELRFMARGDDDDPADVFAHCPRCGKPWRWDDGTG